jgi:hypothetical protein
LTEPLAPEKLVKVQYRVDPGIAGDGVGETHRTDPERTGNRRAKDPIHQS